MLDLSSIATIGSAGFLPTFGAVNLANIRLGKSTNSKRWISFLGMMACLGALLSLIWQTVKDSPDRLFILGAMMIPAKTIESLYRLSRGRKIRLTTVL